MTHEQTPVQRAGFEVGDRAVVYGNPTMFSDGSIVELERDDGSAYPKFKLISGYCAYNNAAGGRPGGYCALAHVQKLTIPHYTPKPGDYVRTANLTESEYHQIAALFMAAGADAGEYPDHIEYREQTKFGYSTDGCLFHGCGGLQFGGAELILHDGRIVPVESVDLDPLDWTVPGGENTLQQQLYDLRRRIEKLESSGTEIPGGVEDDVPPCPICGQDHVPGMTTGRSGTQYYCSRKRPSGFYWVDTSPTGRGYWEPAEYNQVRCEWHVLHDDAPMFDSDFNTIGPRIHPPED